MIMIRVISRGLLCLFLLVASHSYAQLTGSFIIGSSPSADYNDFSAAIADMEAQGVVGDVVFGIEPGVYAEQFLIDSTRIPGLSSADLIFEGLGDRDEALITFDANTVITNYTVSLDQAVHVTFRRLTFGNTSPDVASVLYIDNSLDITIDDCHIIGQVATSPTDFITLIFVGGSEQFNLTNSLLENGNFGLSFDGVLRGNILNNTFLHQFRQGLSLGNNFGVRMENNVVQNLETSFANYLGLEFWSSFDFDLKRNRFVLNNGQAALFLNGDAILDSTSIDIFNNYFDIRSTSNTTSAIFWLATDNVDFIHNTVNVSSGDKCVLFVSGFENRLLNNNMINLGGFEVYSGNGINMNEVDFNNIFASGPLSSFGSSFPEHQQTGMIDLNSVNFNVPFIEDGTPRVCHYGLDGSATMVVAVQDDFFSQPRNDPRDIGAVEFDLPMPVIIQEEEVTICEGDQYEITAGGAFGSYLWSTGETTTSITVSEGGTFSVEVIDGTNCTLFDSLIVNVRVATVELGEDQAVCEGASTVIRAPGGFVTYQWSNGSAADTTFVTEEGPVSVTVTDDLGCEATDELTINFAGETIDPNFLVVAQGCTVDTLQFIELSDKIPDSFFWEFGDGITSTEQNPIHSFEEPGTYNVTLTVTLEDCMDRQRVKPVTISDCADSEGGRRLVPPGFESFVQEFEKPFTVFPNPSAGIVSVRLVQQGEISGWIALYTSWGKFLDRWPIAGSDEIVEKLDLTHQPPGIYLVRFETNEGRGVKRVVIR